MLRQRLNVAGEIEVAGSRRFERQIGFREVRPAAESRGGGKTEGQCGKQIFHGFISFMTG
jgi:hypothetical protein